MYYRTGGCAGPQCTEQPRHTAAWSTLFENMFYFSRNIYENSSKQKQQFIILFLWLNLLLVDGLHGIALDVAQDLEDLLGAGADVQPRFAEQK